MADSIPTTSLSATGGTAGTPSSFSSGPSYQTGANTGNGVGVYGGLTTTTRLPSLSFRSLRAGDGIQLSLDQDSATIEITANAAASLPTYTSARDLIITQNGVTVQFNLSNTSVVPGTYPNANIVVDAKGRILSVSQSNAAVANVSIGIVSTSDLLISNTPVVNNGTFTIDLATTGVTPGTYTLATVAVDSKGRVRSISNGTVVNATNGTVTSVILNGSNAVSVAAGPSTTRDVFYQLDLNNTGVTPGQYTLASFTVDAQGRISNAISGTQTDIGVTRVSMLGSNAVAISGSPISNQGTFTVDLTMTGVTAGQYICPTIAVDAQGRITSVATGTAVTTFTVNDADMTLNGQNVTGQGTSLTATGTVVVGLTNTGVTPGSYTSVDLTVDSKGRIRAISNGGSGGTVKSVAISVGAGLTVLGSPITSAGTIQIGLAASGVAEGTYTSVTVDAHGRITAGGVVANTDVIAALGFTPVNPAAAVFTQAARGITAGSGDSSSNFSTTAYVQREIAAAVANAVALLRAEFMANAGA
jgi:hypothetical protein